MAFFVRPCSGCYETEDGYPVGEYEFDKKAGIPKGSGCRECGYTGKRRTYFDPKEFEKLEQFIMGEARDDIKERK